MTLFLGVDGGQSATVALLGDESGRVLGIGRAGPCNHAAAGEGLKRFTLAVRGSVRAAVKQAGVKEGVFESAAFGFSGGPADKDTLTRALVKAERYLITHDARTALTGATGGGPGVIVIAGTGSIAYGRNRAGEVARAGGWGYIFGDEGGAFDLVRQAIRAMLRHEEGWGSPTALTRLLLEASGSAGAAGANQLLHRFYTDDYPRHKVAALAPLIDQAAAEGDQTAQDILKASAQSLAALAATVRRQLFPPGELPAPTSFTGGVFRSRTLLERFRMLVELDGDTRLIAPLYGPAAGALIEAYRAAGLSCLPQEVPDEKGAIP